VIRRQALAFTAPGQVALIEEELPPPGPGQLLVRARLSAISAGTELLAYRGQLSADLALDETLPSLAGGSFRYPFRYGYASVGEVVDVGPGVGGEWRGRRVFSFQPHASAFAVAAGEVFVVPDGIGWEAAALYASQETACNLVLDGRPQLGERVVVVGQGVVGLLTTALLARFPLASLAAVDSDPARAALARRFGASADPVSAAAPESADLTFELSGAPAALDTAIALTGREGRVVVGSFYGAKRAPVDLGGHFHRGRLTLISSQVSHLPPALGARWDRARRRDVAWDALGRVDSGALISHRLPLDRAGEAYQLLDRGPGAGVLQVLLVHD
jgi:2-desacetyl-2-hydroxyethyl bacteriochlorophyllide A dehydrogenase